jgi:hypothetical protein
MNMSEIQNYHFNLFRTGVLKETVGTVWGQHNGNSSNLDYPWKLHLYADGYTDWYTLSRIVIPYLVQQNATFKTILPDNYSVNCILNNRSEGQFGKAFTIYPNNETEFKRLAIGLNYILNQANLHAVSAPNTQKHNIGFERSLGNTGRIFYRAERDARGEYIAASDAVVINPVRPYNPYNLQDPFENLFQQKSQNASVTDIVTKIKQVASIQHIKNSADNNCASVYFFPKISGNEAYLENLFKAAGIKYDIHFSRLMGRSVIRVLNQDMPYKELLPSNSAAQTYNGYGR